MQKKKAMTKEEMRAPSRSLQRLMTMTDDSAQMLADAVICVAADDYRLARFKGYRKLQAELEEFFRSAWAAFLSSGDPVFILEQLQQEDPSDYVRQIGV